MATPRTAAMARGVHAMAPIAPAVAVFGAVAGIAALQAGYSTWLAGAASVVLYAGSAQLAITQMMAEHASAALIVVTALIVNLRFMLYSAAISPLFRNVPVARRMALAYLLSDQGYGLYVYEATRGRSQHELLWFYASASVMMWLSYVLGSLAGVWLGASIPPNWSLDFIVPLMFIAITVPVMRDRASVIAALVAGATCLVVFRLPNYTGLYVATACGIAAGLATEWRPRRCV